MYYHIVSVHVIKHHSFLVHVGHCVIALCYVQELQLSHIHLCNSVGVAMATTMAWLLSSSRLQESG